MADMTAPTTRAAKARVELLTFVFAALGPEKSDALRDSIHRYADQFEAEARAEAAAQERERLWQTAAREWAAIDLDHTEFPCPHHESLLAILAEPSDD